MNIYYYYMSLAVGKSVVVEPEPSGTSSISGLPNKMSAQPNRVVLEKKMLEVLLFHQHNYRKIQSIKLF